VTSSHHARVKNLFLHACELPEEERRGFLDAECPEDNELRREVEDLLRFYEPPAEHQPQIGGYRLIRSLGEGGMGEVWQAEQEEPVRRPVAVKLIKAGMDSRQVVARFESERRALALMDHPNVAHVYDAGATRDGRPYFVMELLNGTPITSYCDGGLLTIRERLEIFLAVCNGVQHAHQKGVIHRDIKPSNILIQEVDGRPLPKVIDFGVAKATGGEVLDPSAATAHGVLLGTPGYMSPEQARSSGLDVDTRADVYSLGVVLYELLAGVAPLEPLRERDESLEEVLRRIREEDPPKPSARVDALGAEGAAIARARGTTPIALVRNLRADLDWIVMKALEKGRERRYESAAALAEDLRRHTRDEVVRAGPPSVVYRARKFVRRHRVAVLAGVAVMAAMAVGALGAGLGMFRAQREAEKAQRVSELLLSTFEELNPNTRGEGPASAEALLGLGVANIDAELDDEPLVQARLFTSMGQAYLALGRFNQARSALTRAVTLRTEYLGADDRETLEAMNQLGEILWQLDELDEAERILAATLVAQRRVLGSWDPAVGQTLQNLGAVHLRKRDFDAARGFTEAALDISLRTRGPDHFDLATNLFWLAGIDFAQGDHEASRARTLRSLEIVEATVGTDHPFAAWPLFQLGLLHSVDGSADSAKSYQRRSLDIQERSLGPGHPNLAYPLQALGELLRAEGDYATAKPMLERALRVTEAAFGRDHPLLVQALNRLGATLRDMGDLEGAIAAHRRALLILQDVSSFHAGSLRPTLELLIRAEEAAGNSVEARRLRVRADSNPGAGSG
jgi:non-specific serine/threonine protein kinase/serine/threonine-protein kinase